MKKYKNIFLIAILTIFVVSCAYNAGFVKTTFDMLGGSKVSYDTAMKMTADLYNRGIISEGQKSTIITYGNTYSKAHNTAVEALARYEETKSSEDSAIVEQQITIATTALSSLLNIIQPYLIDKKEISK